MATAPDQSILDALRGYAIESMTKNPKPRLVKIYISSTKHGKWREERRSCLETLMSFYWIFHHLEFKEERKVLLEVIGPELQSIFDDRQIEVREKLSLINWITIHFFSSTDWICWHAFWHWSCTHNHRLGSLCYFWSLTRNSNMLSSIEGNILDCEFLKERKNEDDGDRRRI